MTEKMKPCPFCGSEDISIETESDVMGKIARAHCEICGATASGIGVMSRPDSDADLHPTAIAAWNRRTPHDPDLAAAVGEIGETMTHADGSPIDSDWCEVWINANALRTILDHFEKEPPDAE